MASRPPPPDFQGYDTPKFEKISIDLHKTCVYEINRAKSVMSKLDSNGSSFNYQDKGNFKNDIKELVTSRVHFITVMKSVHAGKNVTVKQIENSYDSYCYALGMLTSVTDMWETVTASGIIKTVISMIALVGKAHANVQANGRRLEKELEALKKILKKAEKSKNVSYIKAGLSLALDVAIVLSPQVRALSVISKFAVGGLIDVGSNAIFGKPKDFIGTTIGMTTSGAEIEYKARGLTKGADALAKASKALKISGMVGAAGDIKKAHKTVSEIKASIAKMRKSLIANAKYLRVTAKSVEVAKRDIRNLLQRLQANAAKVDNAESNYQKLKSLRSNI